MTHKKKGSAFRYTGVLGDVGGTGNGNGAPGQSGGQGQSGFGQTQGQGQSQSGGQGQGGSGSQGGGQGQGHKAHHTMLAAAINKILRTNKDKGTQKKLKSLQILNDRLKALVKK